MSIKTLRKRIALVAVSALGGGLLSVVAMAPANAATLVTLKANGGGSTTTSAGSNGLLNSLDSGSATAVAGSSANAIEDDATTATARLQVGGRLAITVAGNSTTSVVRVLGAPITDWASASGSLASINLSSTVITAEASQALTVVITPNGAAGSQFTIEAWDTLSEYSSGNDANTKVTVTLVATGTQNTLDASNSNNRFSLNTDTTATAVDGSGANYVDWNESGVYLNYVLYDANNNALTNKGITCSATGTGVLVAVNSTAATNLLSNSSSAVDSDTTSGYCYVVRAVANTPASTTVTVSVSGTAIGSKSITFVGEASKVLISSVLRQTTLSSALTKTDSYEYNVVDSAGNTLSSRTVAIASSGLNAFVQAATAGSTAAYSAAALSTGGWTCTTTAGSASLVAYALKADGITRVNSDPFTAVCAGDPYTYTASLDKAVYVPGDIATLSITAKDSKGNLTNSYADVGATATPIAISGSQMTAVTAPTNTDSFTNGVRTYKFVVGTTEGSYNMVVDMPAWNTSGVQAAVTVPYKVSLGTTTVTNAEVLAAIVKLIASINKQIRALQKSLRR